MNLIEKSLNSKNVHTLQSYTNSRALGQEWFEFFWIVIMDGLAYELILLLSLITNTWSLSIT